MCLAQENIQYKKRAVNRSARRNHLCAERPQPAQGTMPARIDEAFLKTCQGWQEQLMLPIIESITF